MNRHLFMAAPLALCLFAAPVAGSEATEPPAEYADYIAAARKADSIDDPLQRCLAYPDLPGNTWLPGLAKARCVLFLTPPAYSLDEIAETLSLPDGAATLEAHFQGLLDAHFEVPAQQDRIAIELAVFRDKDRDKAERVARAWLAAAPESAFAHTALGEVLSWRGWDARGTKIVRDTPEENMRKMTAFLAQAAGEFAAALEANPKLFPACEGLMSIGRASSDEVQAYATHICLEVAPTSFTVLEEAMTAAEPRWGGSESAMRMVEAYAQARVADNPLLTLLVFHHAYDKIRQMEDRNDEVIAVIEPASLRIPNAGYLRLVGKTYVRRDDHWMSVVYLSQALRFSPRDAWEQRAHARALVILGDFEWAHLAAERAIEVDPESGDAWQLLGDAIFGLEGPAAAVPHYRHAMEYPKVRESAHNSLCDSWMQAEMRKEATECVDDMIAAYPYNPEGWRRRLVLIGYDAPGSKEAIERFLALQDPERWEYQAAIAKEIRGILKAKARYSAPPGELGKRRAEAIKRMQATAGNTYDARVHSEVSGVFENTMDTCNRVRRRDHPTQFSAVMDVQPDGTLTNISVEPVNTFSICFAEQFETTWVLPTPPDEPGSAGYPYYFHLELR